MRVSTGLFAASSALLLVGGSLENMIFELFPDLWVGEVTRFKLGMSVFMNHLFALETIIAAIALALFLLGIFALVREARGRVGS